MTRLLLTIILLPVLVFTSGCYTLVKQPGQSVPNNADSHVVREYTGETIFTGTTTLPWSEVGVATTVHGARELMNRLRPDSSAVASAMRTDFLRRMLVVVAWGVSPPAQLVVENITIAGGQLHIFVRADYGDFRTNKPPSPTVTAPVAAITVPAHNGRIVMHMAPRYAWSEAQSRWVIAPTQWSSLGDLDQIDVLFREWDAQPYAPEDFILD